MDGSTPTDPDPRSAPLKVLQGEPAPAEVQDGWRRLSRFPDGALNRWWTLLEPALAKPDLLRDGRRVAEFAEHFALDHDDVRVAVQASAVLVGRAVAIDLPVDDLKEDLTTLSGRFGSAAEAVTAGYRDRIRGLRKLAFERSLVDHGNTMVGLEWRIDQVSASSHAIGLDSSVVLLTLRYQRGDDVERLTLQLTPSALNQLREFVGRFDG